MRKSRIGMPRLFVVLSLALAGLMALQVMLLRYAWDLKEQALESGARTALASAVLALQSREIEGSAFEYFFSHADTLHGNTFVTNPDSWSTHTTYRVWGVGDDTPAPPATPGPHAPVAVAEAKRRFRTVRRDIRRLSGTRDTDVAVELAAEPGDSLIVIVRPEPGFPGDVLAIHKAPDVSLRHVVGEWINAAPRPIRERLDADGIAATLRDELATVGIGAEPAFGVVRPAAEARLGALYRGGVQAPDTGGARVVLASDNITDAELLDSAYRQELFPLDPFGARHELVLAFPEDRVYLLKQIGPLWAASVLFISVIIFSFVKAWRTNAEQRRFGGQLIDFINNMTHEFKTPISTVALAGEAMARTDVQGDRALLGRYVGMIRDENARMHRQVEKILAMARFERGDIEMKREPVDLNGVLRDVAESFTLQVERCGGELVCECGAPSAVVEGDRVHLESIFANLVDNAVKYSGAGARVRVATARGRDGWLEVKVSDRGPGIPRADQRRVFEKYYRCPTGDRHDVKGFGLGLAFVHSLVRAHGGQVELHSLEGEGTTVTVSLPPAPDEETT